MTVACALLRLFPDSILLWAPGQVEPGWCAGSRSGIKVCRGTFAFETSNENVKQNGIKPVRCRIDFRA